MAAEARVWLAFATVTVICEWGGETKGTALESGQLFVFHHVVYMSSRVDSGVGDSVSVNGNRDRVYQTAVPAASWHQKRYRPAIYKAKCMFWQSCMVMVHRGVPVRPGYESEVARMLCATIFAI